MGKAKKATRKELEAVIGKLIQEVQYLRQGFTAIDSYLGAYVKFKGDTLTFNEFLNKEINKAQDVKKSTISEDVKSDKKERYNRITTPTQ